MRLPKSASALWHYVLGVALVAVATLLGLPLHEVVSPVNLVMFYLTAVVIAAVYLGRGPALLTTVLSVMAFDFLLVPPQLTFAVSNSEFILTFLGLFIVGLVISELTARTREQVRIAQRREVQTAELYEFSRDLAVAATLEDVNNAIVADLSQNFSRQVAVFLSLDDTLALSACTPGTTLTEGELAAADWAFQHGQTAGLGTGTLSVAGAHYVPLKTARGVVGVLGVKEPTTPGRLTSEQKRQMETFASQAALAIERAQFAEVTRQARLVQAREELQTALLNSISHDLRTPLASITGILSSLTDEARLDEATRRSLLETAQEEAERLNRLMGNLLDMTRLESGALKLTQELTDVQDLVGSALGQLADRLQSRKVIVSVADGLPSVPMDFVCICQALVNLLDNALKYSPMDAPIEVSAMVVDSEMRIQVADRGAGIPAGNLDRIFEKFYRVQHFNRMGGTGLGLSICKGIVEAHGGRIWAQNREGGGSLFTMDLPLDNKAWKQQ